MQDTIQLIWLRALVALSENRKLSATGVELGKDATSVGRYINKLQKAVGSPLLCDAAQGELTDQGKAVLAFAQRFITEYAELKAGLREMEAKARREAASASGATDGPTP